MRKYPVGVILFTITLLFSVGYIARHIYQRKALENNRHLLFCETLKPGMSITEVSDILKGKGKVIIEEADGNSQYTHYSILFTDRKEQNLYGGWIELMFVQGKYNKAYIVGFDSYEEICDFGLSPK